jgi:hypothetical protein
MLATKKKPGRKVGRFFPCPANGDNHPEQIACEVKETIDAKGKTRHSFVCPLCSTRTFLNNWEPEHSLRTIVWAESQGLHCMGVMQRRKDALLKELGLERMPPPGPPGPPPGPPPPPPGFPYRPAPRRGPKKPKK